MEKRYQVEIKRLSSNKVIKLVDILAHSKTEARRHAKVIYNIDKYANRIIGKAYEYNYK